MYGRGGAFSVAWLSRVMATDSRKTQVIDQLERMLGLHHLPLARHVSAWMFGRASGW
jgi:hypothetical protein